MLVLKLVQGQNHVTLTVPPSRNETRVRISVEDVGSAARLGFVAPPEVLILRSDAKHVLTQAQSRLRSRRRTLLRDER